MAAIWAATFFFTRQSLLAQEIRIPKASGYCEKNDQVTLAEVKKCALSNALKDALEQAGVEMEVKSVFVQESSTNDENYIFDVNSRFIGANIISFEEPYYREEQNELIASIENVIVKKHKKKRDSEFTFALTGIRNTYVNNENLTFTVNPNKDGYLNIFFIDQNQAFKLFPNPEEPDYYLQKNVDYSFPQSIFLDYVMEATETQSNTLVFILTKEDIAFAEEMTGKEMYHTLYSLEPDKRYHKIHPLNILEK